MIVPNFKHQQYAHCESGVSVNLLRHYGLELSEPMVFGIGAGLFFAHLPFVKVNGVPGTTFRIFPGYIFKRLCDRLGVKIHRESFRSEAAGMKALDETLAQGRPAGMLSSVYYLSYLPPAFRFHFNAHNLIVYGKEGNEYLVSDPIMETVTRLSAEDLAKARFAKGFPEPKGKMYYPVAAPKQADLRDPIIKGIKQTCWFMLTPPMPMFGYKGIKYLGKHIQQYPHKLDSRKATLYLGNIIRMQEEIGTGGAGFRFLYAAFLQEAGTLLQNDLLLEQSQAMTKIGDQWRNFAYSAARTCKDRSTNRVSYSELGDMLMEISDKEKTLFERLKKIR
jgi:hypothetical protein